MSQETGKSYAVLMVEHTGIAAERTSEPEKAAQAAAHIRMMIMVDIMAEPTAEMAGETQDLVKEELQKHSEKTRVLHTLAVAPVVEKEPEDEPLDMEAPAEITAVEMVDADVTE